MLEDWLLSLMSTLVMDFWTARLMKVFGHEGKCTCKYNTHGWIVYIMLFPVVCGTSRVSSWLKRNEFLKMTK
jgi:hypothetical protein